MSGARTDVPDQLAGNSRCRRSRKLNQQIIVSRCKHASLHDPPVAQYYTPVIGQGPRQASFVQPDFANLTRAEFQPAECRHRQGFAMMAKVRHIDDANLLHGAEVAYVLIIQSPEVAVQYPQAGLRGSTI